jgi:hypothetical protein
LRLEALEERWLPSAVVSTDQQNYAPGDTAYITGSGYGANESINLNILLATGTQGAAWSVADDAYGNFSTSVGIPSDGSWATDSVNPLTLTATGQTSGLSAQTTFTDAAASLAQWQNLGAGSWVNGDLNPQKATLYEGDSVAYQDQFTSLKTASGNVYTFGIQWETTKAGTHAQD